MLNEYRYECMTGEHYTSLVRLTWTKGCRKENVRLSEINSRDYLNVSLIVEHISRRAAFSLSELPFLFVDNAHFNRIVLSLPSYRIAIYEILKSWEWRVHPLPLLSGVVVWVSAHFRACPASQPFYTGHQIYVGIRRTRSTSCVSSIFVQKNPKRTQTAHYLPTYNST